MSWFALRLVVHKVFAMRICLTVLYITNPQKFPTKSLSDGCHLILSLFQ